MRLCGASGQPLDRGRPQGRRVRVEAEHDTTAALVNERREPVGEVRAQAPVKLAAPRPSMEAPDEPGARVDCASRP